MSEESINIHEVVVPTGLDSLKKKMKLKGTVTRLELYGAFIDVNLDAPAILHISQLGQKVNRIGDALKVGDEVMVWVEKLDSARNQVMVTMVQPLAVEWGDLAEGQVHTGKVTRLENFGAFIDIGAEKEGLAHVSELSHAYVKHPQEVLKVGDEVQVQVLGFNKKKRRINLSLKALQEKPEPVVKQAASTEPEYEEEEEEEEEDMVLTAMELALRSAMNDAGMPYRSKDHKQKKNNRNQRGGRRQQEEIFSRTLALKHSGR